jgi:protein phosphatase 2C family protein 2/3
MFLGSCSLVVLIVGDMCYIANVGDSRAIMSGEGGSRIFALSKDHKPMEETEFKRISAAGGKIYQAKSTNSEGMDNQIKETFGPCRILPGRLSVLIFYFVS